MRPKRKLTAYERVTLKATKYGYCPRCKGRSRRIRTFSQMINPFNRNPDGSQKDATDIRNALAAEIEKWEPNYYHEGC